MIIQYLRWNTLQGIVERLIIIAKSVQLHPNQEEYVCISGASLIVTNLKDPHQQFFLQGHDDQITTFSISNSGTQIASGQKGDNADVILWDFKSKRALFKLSEHDHEVVCVEFSHDDRLLLSCGSPMDKKMFIWDTTNGYIVGSLLQIPEPTSVAKWGGFAKDIKGRDTTKYQMATAGNKQICLWKLDAHTGIFEHEMVNTGNLIREYLCMEFSKNREDYLLLGTTSGDFCVFQMKNNHYITVGALGVQSMKFIDLSRFLIGVGNGTIAQYQFTQDAKIVQTQKTELQGGVNSISCQSNSCLCATDKGMIYYINPETFQKQLHSENHTGGIVHLGYQGMNPENFASASEDGSIRIWDISNYAVTGRCLSNTTCIPLCLVYRDEVLLSGWQDGKIRMYKSADGQLIWYIDDAHKGGVYTLCMAANLKFFCSGGGEGDVRVWEMRTRELVCHLKEHTHRVTKVQLMGNEQQLITASRDRALLQWDLPSEKRISAHIQRMGGINSFDVVPKSSTIISTGQDRKFTYWDLNQVNSLSQVDTSYDPKRGDECYSLAISNNGKYIAMGGSSCILKVWELSSAKLIAQGMGHSGPINTVSFAPDDKQIISGGKDGVVILWNLFV